MAWPRLRSLGASEDAHLGGLARCVQQGCGKQMTRRLTVDYSSAGKLAKRAIKKNPDKTNRAIAAELGIDESTVREARQPNRNPRLKMRKPKPFDPRDIVQVKNLRRVTFQR